MPKEDNFDHYDDILDQIPEEKLLEHLAKKSTEEEDIQTQIIPTDFLHPSRS